MDVMVFVAVGLFVMAVVAFVYFVCAHKTAGEGQAYVYGDKVITNSGGFVFLPTGRRVLDLARRPITTSAAPARTRDHQLVTVTLDADVSVPADHESIRIAARHFAGVEDTIDAVAGELLESAVASILATCDQADLADRAGFAERVRSRANSGLARLGLTLDSVQISSLVTTPDELIAR